MGGSPDCTRRRACPAQGSFKCAHLEAGNDFVLLGEGVAPGFDFRDFAFVTAAELAAEEDKRFLALAAPFVEWLRDAESEEESEEETEESEEEEDE